MGYSKHELPTRKRNDYKEKTLTIMYKMLVLTLQNDTSTDESCPYCKKIHHTLKQCWLKKSDENLKDEVNTLIPSLKRTSLKVGIPLE